MSWLGIGLLLLFGLLLIMAEVFFIPGTTFVALLGVMFVLAGVASAYVYQGAESGHITLAVSGVVSVALLIYGFRVIRSSNVGLDESVTSHVDTRDEDAVQVGDEGVTFSYLRPNGKAIFNDQKIGVYSQGDYIESNRKVKVVKKDEHKVYVKPIDD